MAICAEVVAVFTMRLKWLTAFVLLCGIPALAGPILLNNTGAGSTSGGIDPNWILQPGANYPAYEVTPGSPQFASWLADDVTSQWIGPRPSYTEGMSDTAGNWVFQTTFSLTGMVPSTASITGRWLADNQGINIYLNGAILSQTTTLNDFTNWSAFSLPVSSNFVSGLNTLDFVVNNTGGPVGLRVEFLTGSADDAVPEPATFGLFGGGLLGLLGLGLARRKRA